MNSNPYYCALLYKGLYLEKVSPTEFLPSSCCAMRRAPVTDQIDFVNNEFLKEKRILAKTMPLPECQQCWDLERSAGRSHRTEANEWLETLGNDIDPYVTELLRFDYNVDMLCNARCIVCSSWFSSLWATEDLQNNLTPSRNYTIIKKNNFNQLDVSKIRRVYFNGGEPMLSTQPEEFLSQIKSQKNLNNLTVIFSTNGSTLPSEQLTALLKQCQKVEIVISLDATGTAFEYIRNPLSWASVESNCAKMSQLADNIHLGISNNIGIHNVDEVIAIQQWYENISKTVKIANISYNQTVGTLTLSNASAQLLEIWRAKFNRIKDHAPVINQFINTIDHCAGQSNDNQWLNHLREIDRRRTLNWTQALPNLYDSYKKITGSC